jgi:hypothetical protein
VPVQRPATEKAGERTPTAGSPVVAWRQIFRGARQNCSPFSDGHDRPSVACDGACCPIATNTLGARPGCAVIGVALIERCVFGDHDCTLPGMLVAVALAYAWDGAVACDVLDPHSALGHMLSPVASGDCCVVGAHWLTSSRCGSSAASLPGCGRASVHRGSKGKKYPGAHLGNQPMSRFGGAAAAASHWWV